MKIKVTTPFHDKRHFSTVYCVGQVVEFDEARAMSVVERGLATLLDQPKVEEAPMVEEPTMEENNTEEVEQEQPVEAKEDNDTPEAPKRRGRKTSK